MPSQGICVLSMDCRGQNGQSQDRRRAPEGHYAGWMTQGIRDPAQYYYRYVYADAVRRLELLAQRDEVDDEPPGDHRREPGRRDYHWRSRRCRSGRFCRCPISRFCAIIKRAIEIATHGPYPEIPRFLKSFPHLYDDAIRTLSYCDCLNLAPWIKCRTVVSNCLWDDTCPPSTIFGVYNHIAAEKQIEVYPFHKHEVPYDHQETKFRLIVEMLRP